MTESVANYLVKGTVIIIPSSSDFDSLLYGRTGLERRPNHHQSFEISESDTFPCPFCPMRLNRYELHKNNSDQRFQTVISHL
mmetsp:Transcript_47690/g.54921  ORF Transcript_47690/g.54921 Transcript_47690/m.54921 type:complete len:82 (+) Transcript_47690:836-1081(+)